MLLDCAYFAGTRLLEELLLLWFKLLCNLASKGSLRPCEAVQTQRQTGGLANKAQACADEGVSMHDSLLHLRSAVGSAQLCKRLKVSKLLYCFYC